MFNVATTPKKTGSAESAEMKRLLKQESALNASSPSQLESLGAGIRSVIERNSSYQKEVARVSDAIKNSLDYEHFKTSSRINGLSKTTYDFLKANESNPTQLQNLTSLFVHPQTSQIKTAEGQRATLSLINTTGANSSDVSYEVMLAKVMNRHHVENAAKMLGISSAEREKLTSAFNAKESNEMALNGIQTDRFFLGEREKQAKELENRYAVAKENSERLRGWKKDWATDIQSPGFLNQRRDKEVVLASTDKTLLEIVRERQAEVKLPPARIPQAKHHQETQPENNEPIARLKTAGTKIINKPTPAKTQGNIVEEPILQPTSKNPAPKRRVTPQPIIINRHQELSELADRVESNLGLVLEDSARTKWQDLIASCRSNVTNQSPNQVMIQYHQKQLEILDRWQTQHKDSVEYTLELKDEVKKIANELIAKDLNGKSKLDFLDNSFQNQSTKKKWEQFISQIDQDFQAEVKKPGATQVDLQKFLDGKLAQLNSISDFIQDQFLV